MIKGFTGGFLNPMISQFRGLQAILKEFSAEVVIHEMSFAGVLPFTSRSSFRAACEHLPGCHAAAPCAHRRSTVGSGVAGERISGKAKGYDANHRQFCREVAHVDDTIFG